jgi:hypothetical protein
MITDYPDPFQPFLFSAIARNEDLRLEAFAVEGVTGTAWQTFQTTPNGGWHTWLSRGRPPGRMLDGFSMLVAANADGRLELFASAAVDDDHGDLWHVWQTAPNNGWSTWQSFGSPGGGTTSGGGDVAVGSSSNGALHVFVTASDQNMWHRWQTRPNGGWSEWTNRARPSSTTRIWLPAVHAS